MSHVTLPSALRTVTLTASFVLSFAATGCGSSDDANRGQNADPSMSSGGSANGAGGETSGASGGSQTTGTGGAAVSGPNAPTIPALTEQQCPPFQDSTVTFMGLAGVQIAAGTKPAAATAPLVFYWHGTGSNSGEFS